MYATDLRTIGATGGIAAAYANLTRSSNQVTFVPGSLVVGPLFGSSNSGSIDPGGNVSDAGGIDTGTAVGSQTPELLFTVNGTVSQSTAPGTVISLATSQDTATGQGTTVFGNSTTVAANYASANLEVPAHPWQNPVDRYDVNNDGYVNILDIVKLVGEMNAGFGGTSGGLPSSPKSSDPTGLPPPYVDINGDGFFNVQDVIMLVGYINSHGSVAVPSQGSASGRPCPRPSPRCRPAAAAPVSRRPPRPRYLQRFHR